MMNNTDVADDARFLGYFKTLINRKLRRRVPQKLTFSQAVSGLRSSACLLYDLQLRQGSQADRAESRPHSLVHRVGRSPSGRGRYLRIAADLLPSVPGT